MSSLLERLRRASAASSPKAKAMPKLIFICDLIKSGNVNVPEYQRAKMLTQKFRTAILYRWDIAESIRGECEVVYRVRGKIFAVLHGFLLILYLRIARGYKIVYTGPNIFAIMWGSLAKSLLGCKWVFDLWDHPSLELASSELASAHPFSALVKKPLYSMLLQRRPADADAWIIGMHMGILNYMPKSYPRKKIVHVTNGIDLSVMERILRQEPEVHEGEGDKALNVCHAGAMSAWRGMGVLLEGLESLDTDYRIKVECFGPSDAHDTDDILRAIENHNQSSPHKIHYHGYLPHEEALAKMAESEVCLCILDTSVMNYKYAYAVKIFEYLALGKVIVASRTVASSEIIRDGDNGFLISFSGDSLRMVLERIIEMKERGELAKVERAACESAKFYRWEDINRKIVSHLDTVLKGH